MAQRKYSEAQRESARKWDSANLDRLSIALPVGSRDKIKAHANTHSESVNKFIARAIAETMERDSTGGPQEAAGAPTGAGALPSETVKAAQEAAQAAGEDTVQFINRAILETAERDKGASR